MKTNKVSRRLFRSSDVSPHETVCPCEGENEKEIFSPRLQGGAAADAQHSTRRARTRGPSARARTREGHRTVRTRPFRTSPASSPDRYAPHPSLATWSFAKCPGATPECECTFSEHRPALGARAREPTRGADPREGGFAFAHIFPRSQLAAAMESRRTRDRGEAPARERSNVRFFPRFFSARFKRPVGGPDGVLTESSPPRARTPCHAIPRLALARFQTRIVVASARAGWPRARDTRLPRRAPPRILRARAKRTRRARPRKPPPERQSQNPTTRRNRTRFRLHLRPFPRWRSAHAAVAVAA